MSTSRSAHASTVHPHGCTLRILASEAPERTGEEFAVDHPVTIGRDGECQVVLADPSVSRRHARVEEVPELEEVKR